MFKKCTTVAITAAALFVGTAEAGGKHVPGCHSARCDRVANAAYKRHHERLGPLQTVGRATVYSGPCDGQTTVLADGHSIYNAPGHWIASTFLRLGTRIRFTRPVFGATDYTVRDTGGYFDVYVPDCKFGSWNNPSLSFRVITSR